MYGWKDCRAEQRRRKRGGFASFLTCLLTLVDFAWRRSDFRWNRGPGGLAERWFGGHPPVALLLPALLGAFLVWGPGLGWRGGNALLLYVGALVVLLFGMRSFRDSRALWFQLVWVTLLSVLVWSIAGADARQIDGTLYRHLIAGLVPATLVPAILLAILLSRVLVRWLPGRYADGFRGSLQKTELFQRPEYAEIGPATVGMGILNAVLRHPLILAWLPALVLVVFVRRHEVGGIALFWLLVSLILLALATIHPRLDAGLALVRRVLFRGGQLLVSLALIVLGGARVAGIHYVSDLLESSSRFTLFFFVLTGYAFFWFYEYWLNWSLCRHLLNLFHSAPGVHTDGQRVGRVVHDTDLPADERTHVSQKGRALQIHGGARFVAIGTKLSGSGATPFQLYERGALFDRLGQKGDPNALASIRGRMRLYFTLTNVLLVGASGYGAYRLSTGPQLPVAQGDLSVEGQVDLRDLLFTDRSADEPAILLAVSGGGTRAAMYATSVLEGLAGLDALDNLVLTSGVSGGGASLAYYSGHHAALDTRTDSAWQSYRCTMDDPFIGDVLESAPEWRVLTETRLGQLLSESFDRRFRNPVRTFGDLPGDRGLILNTALAGSLRIPDDASTSDCAADGATFVQCADRFEDYSDSRLAGGRLIFTNLRPASAFPGTATSAAKLDYVVFADPSVPLTTAAALQANFPPVFSNAPVDAYRTRERFWVTDGGAVDNRGIVSLLLALRDALERQVAATPAPPDSITLPPIHVIVADASGGSFEYGQDRGIGSRFGAPAKFASQLMQELLDEIRQLYGALGSADPDRDVRIHYLEMPSVLRLGGGLGTHWMLPRRTTLGDPDQSDPDRRQQTGVSAYAVREVIYQLHLDETGRRPVACADDPETTDAMADDVRRIWNAIAGVDRDQLAGPRPDRGDTHWGVWTGIRDALRPGSNGGGS